MNRSSLLIIRAGALGDTLMLMPLIHALRKRYFITVLGREPGLGYLEPYVDKCIDMERGGWHSLFTGDIKDKLKFPHADYVTAFISDPDNTVSDTLRKHMPESTIHCFTPFPEHKPENHIALYMACALQSAGFPIDCRSVINEAFKSPLIQAHKVSRKKMVLHPGSGSESKNYSPQLWCDLLSDIRKEAFSRKMDICFLLGSAEEAIKEAIIGIAEKNKVETFIYPQKKELLSILNSAHLYIGHDSGITHLAAMLGVNTIALYKNSSVDQWRPLGPAVKVIGPEIGADMVLKKVMRECVAFL